MKHLVILISVILLKSCGSAQNVANVTNDQEMSKSTFLSGIFEIQSLNNYNLSEPLTINFDDEKQSVSGFSGCNRFFGSYKTEENTISFSQIGMTKKLCNGKSNQIEQDFINALGMVTTFEITETGLNLRSDTDVLIQAKQQVNQRSAEVVKMNVTYNATTRGFFERIWLEDNTIKFTNDRSLQQISSFQISEADLIELSALYSAITIEDIPSLEPPSKTFAYDAAAIATLEVFKDEVSYKTQAFDHGTPPKPIARFVDKLIALKKAMEKQ